MLYFLLILMAIHLSQLLLLTIVCPATVHMDVSVTLLSFKQNKTSTHTVVLLDLMVDVFRSLRITGSYGRIIFSVREHPYYIHC